MIVFFFVINKNEPNNANGKYRKCMVFVRTEKNKKQYNNRDKFIFFSIRSPITLELGGLVKLFVCTCVLDFEIYAKLPRTHAYSCVGVRECNN